MGSSLNLTRIRAASAPELQRSRGRARIRLRGAHGQRTRLADFFQEGCLKLRLPRPETDGDVDALLINTSGGLTGGDALSVDVFLDEGARGTITTPACERIYRSADGDVSVHQRLQVRGGARLDWLPQETILFDRGRLRRRFEIHLERDAEVTAAEAILFGRAAMGETVKSGFLSDFWTVRRDGRVLFADATRLTEPFDQVMACPTVLGGHVAMASLVHVGQDLEAKRDALRSGFSDVERSAAGASVIGDVLVVRMVAQSGRALRECMIPALGCVRGGRPLPRNWHC